MRVLVVGLAGTGEAVAVDARARGDAVVVLEDHPSGDAYAARAARARGLGAEVVERPSPDEMREQAAAADLVVPSPGVPPDHPVITAAVAAGVPVRAEIDLAVERLTSRVPAPHVVAVTGTNGKTTVTSMIAAMCAASGRSSIAVGNIGRPIIDAVDDDVDVVVAEVSTFQLEFTTDAFAPDVAVLLNVAQDHIDWHGSVAAYAAAKAKVFTHQHRDQVAVVNVDDATTRTLSGDAPGRVVTCSRHDPEATYHVVDGAIVGPGGVTVALPGFRAAHDVDNALAASAASLEAGASAPAIEATLAEWTTLPHRVELVATIDGVDFVDDSKATNAHATASALDGLEHVVLLAGGRDRSRNLDTLRPYAPHLKFVVAIGEAAPTVESVFADVVPVVRAGSMHEAVREAAAHAVPGDTVLLSPACASFDWYSGYAERGDDFAREVHTLRAER
ncbi:MAG TPA: UDP-N-acetylmuramoyl-L-alanine--D-glutamate ligase [Acidimicrobiia bacterium]|nr:UDP-N-acetylmuramoyl-L-alanine--D-glutamate ligase [Acidimicrobiia bacterium]